MRKNYFILICICCITLFSCTEDSVILNTDVENQEMNNLCEDGFIEMPGGNVAKEIPNEIFNLIICDLENKSEFTKIEKIRNNYVLEGENYILNKNVTLPIESTRALTEFAIEYRSHIEDIGWTDYSKMGEVTGTTGQSKRLEALQFKYKGQIIPIYDFKVRPFVASMGWLPWVVVGDVAGTTGLSTQMEAVQINVSSSYNIYYRSHVACLGWLPYVFNNEISGTVGQERRMEAFQLFMFKY